MTGTSAPQSLGARRAPPAQPAGGPDSGDDTQQPIHASTLQGPRVPCVYSTQENRGKLEAAGITLICTDPADPASREALITPGITARAGVASPTRAPWINANGWRFIRKPTGQYIYDVPAGKAALAAAEAFAYGADAVLKIDPADVQDLGPMMKFFEGVPPAALPALADIGVVDDGSPVTGEVMNLLARRNLLFQIVKAPSPQFPVNIAIGSKEYPGSDAADPSAFAQKIRRQLTDERRSVRIYGSEVVLARLTGDGQRLRLHLINYGGREIDGLRIRLRGAYGGGEAQVAGVGLVPLEDYVTADGATEFSLPRMLTYAVIDLKAAPADVGPGRIAWFDIATSNLELPTIGPPARIPIEMR